jgi:pimeloyl-ACP methyl ester carboxylesterase
VKHRCGIFVVSAETRTRSESVEGSADPGCPDPELLESGVPASRITVVGASIGAAIALLASPRLQDLDVRVVLLGASLKDSAGRLPAEEGKGQSGRLLSIREASDETSEPCPAWGEDPRSYLRAGRRVSTILRQFPAMFRERPTRSRRAA